MTPDKIYIRAYQDTNRASTHLDNEWVSKPKPFTNSIEYIRKDALLEWAKEVTNDANHSLVYRGAFRDLINKLNSL